MHQAAIETKPVKIEQKKHRNPPTSIFHVYVISHQGIHSIRELKDILVCQRQFTSLFSSHNFIYLFIYFPIFPYLLPKNHTITICYTILLECLICMLEPFETIE